MSAADFDAIATQRKTQSTQSEEDESPDRSRLALQSRPST